MATQYPNLTRAVLRVAIGIGVFFVISALAAGCMTTTITSGQAGVLYSPFGGTEPGKDLRRRAKYPSPVGRCYPLRRSSAGTTGKHGGAVCKRAVHRVRMCLFDGVRTSAGFRAAHHVRYGLLPDIDSARTAQRRPRSYWAVHARGALQQQAHRIAGGYFSQVKVGVDDDFVLVEAILIRDVRLPDQIKVAIEEKLKEEQEAERYEFTIAKERLEAERKQIEAAGEAEYQRIITGA